MDRDKKPIVRRPEVLKKLNAENLQLIERGFLGELPERFRPVPPRGQSTELVVAKPNSLLSSCLPIVPSSPQPYAEKRSPSLENLSSSPLKKSFSFRDRLRMGFFGKDKEKVKWKTISEEEPGRDLPRSLPRLQRQVSSESQQSKSNKRFWFFRQKEFIEKRNKVHSPIYQRSKSFEFLPRLEDEDSDSRVKSSLTNSQSYAYGSSDTLASSNGSADYANVYYDRDNTICLKSIKALQESDQNSSVSTATSASSGIVLNIMKTDSMQDLLDEFNKTVDMFSENYLSDCEPYTRTDGELSVREKRKSSSFSTLPSPKILQVNKVGKASDEFKDELTRILSVRQSSASARSPRRGSVTDWFVLEDKVGQTEHGEVMEIGHNNKYRRAQNKPVKLVRRMSSTKYDAGG